MDLQLRRAYAQLKNNDLDGLVVSSQSSISYLSGFLSQDAYLLISPKGNVYFTDSRYIEAAKIGLKKTVAIKKINGSFAETIAAACKSLGLVKVGFEERNMSYAEYKKIKEELNKDIALIPIHSQIEELRQVKRQDELIKIRKAVQITVKALEAIGDFILPGKRELEVAAELERFIRLSGAWGCAFDIIVASGPNSSFPHHRTSQRKLKNNELVLIDMGVDYLGYKSDLTRVFFLGKIDFLTRKIYDIVLKAQGLAIRETKENALISKVDGAARQYITEQGYGKLFGHNLGHGVGLEIHELPSISPGENNRLKSGMVFTIEPAIYLPNKFGIRLEDMVWLTNQGCEVLSGALHK